MQLPFQPPCLQPRPPKVLQNRPVPFDAPASQVPTNFSWDQTQTTALQKSLQDWHARSSSVWFPDHSPKVQREGREHTQKYKAKTMAKDDMRWHWCLKIGDPQRNWFIHMVPDYTDPPILRQSNNAFPVNQLPECFPCFSFNPRRFPGTWVCKTSLATSQTKGCPRSKNQQLATHPTNLSCSKVGLEHPLTCQLGVPASISCLEVGLLFVTETRCGMEWECINEISMRKSSNEANAECKIVFFHLMACKPKLITDCLPLPAHCRLQQVQQALHPRCLSTNFNHLASGEE